MLKPVLDLLFGRVGRLFLASLVAGGLFAGFVKSQRNVGAKKAIAKVEKNNAQVAAKADAAGTKSLGGVGGVRNPNYRD